MLLPRRWAGCHLGTTLPLEGAAHGGVLSGSSWRFALGLGAFRIGAVSQTVSVPQSSG